MNEPGAHSEKGFEDGLEIERIYILQSHHRKGFGQRLMDFAIEQAKKYNYPFIWLGVWDSDNRAMSFYLKQNFVKKGYHDFIMGNTRLKDALMVLTLV